MRRRDLNSSIACSAVVLIGRWVGSPFLYGCCRETRKLDSETPLACAEFAQHRARRAPRVCSSPQRYMPDFRGTHAETHLAIGAAATPKILNVSMYVPASDDYIQRILLF